LIVTDTIFSAFLESEAGKLVDLCTNSSRLSCKLIQADETLPPSIFVVEMKCRHLVRQDKQVRPSSEPCVIAIQLPADYLRTGGPHPGQILSLLTPRNCWHPNLRFPYICAGPIAPGTSVVDLVFRCYEILTYVKFTPREDNSLNWEACRWARAHMADFPLESRPLRDIGLQESAPDLADTGLADTGLADFVLEPTDAAAGPC
jgi:hypothetical protein